MKARAIELVIFDCDGVLIDSEAIANQVCVEFIARLGHQTTMHEFAARYCGSPIRDIWRRVAADTGLMISEAFAKDVEAEMHRRFDTGLQPIDGVMRMLSTLDLRRCVASSTGRAKLHRNLAQVGLLDAFEPGVFSASQVGRGKPAPDVFLYAASQMGADPADCLVVEDSVAGVAAAGRAGMRCLGFAGGAHVTDAHARRLTDAGAMNVAHSMDELPGLIASLRPDRMDDATAA